jgi:hypothetical protein
MDYNALYRDGQWCRHAVRMKPNLALFAIVNIMAIRFLCLSEGVRINVARFNQRHQGGVAVAVWDVEQNRTRSISGLPVIVSGCILMKNYKGTKGACCAHGGGTKQQQTMF